MHIPDGFLDLKTSVACWTLAGGALALALRRLEREEGPRLIPKMGMTAAFVFVAQMVNFPIAAGTSGHLIGGVLAAVLLGPAAATVAMVCVLLVQALLFGDGGLLALGANSLNMAVIDVTLGWLAYRGFHWMLPLKGPLRSSLSAAFGAWCGTLCASLACAGQLALSGLAPAPLLLPAMTGVHALIGLGEALITFAVLQALLKHRGRAATEMQAHGSPRAGLAQAALAIAALACCAAPLASAWPDGLEWVAEKLGFADQQAMEALLAAPFPDYSLPLNMPAWSATALVGLLGALSVFALSATFTWLGLRFPKLFGVGGHHSH